jgi:hypothetical protein
MITFYVAGHRHEYLPAIDATRARPVRGQQPAETVVGRDAGPTRVLIKVEAITVIDR